MGHLYIFMLTNQKLFTFPKSSLLFYMSREIRREFGCAEFGARRRMNFRSRYKPKTSVRPGKGSSCHHSWLSHVLAHFGPMVLCITKNALKFHHVSPSLTNVWCPAISGTIGHDVGFMWVYHSSSRTYQHESNLTILNTYSKSETEICLNVWSRIRWLVAESQGRHHGYRLSMAVAGFPWNKPAPSWYTTSHGKRFRMLDINSGSMYRAASIPWSCFDSLMFLGMTLGCKLYVRKNIMIVIIIIK